ncbi:MAG: hypothetical protein IKT65_00520 [Clostridia bacterium]|nr:hypothetical protein [Clostridia bacterium]
MSDAVYFISSFGFKHGIPDDADFIFDVRCLSNPYWVEEMRDLCGLDGEVDEYVFADDKSVSYLETVVEVLKLNVDLKENTFKKVYIGCTGGQHRSVAFAERLCKKLCDSGIKSTIVHREYERFK